MENSLPILSDLNQSGNKNKTSSRLGLCVNTHTNGSTPSSPPTGQVPREDAGFPSALPFSPLGTRYFISHTSYGVSKITPSHTRVYSLWSIRKLHFELEISELRGPVSRCGLGSTCVFHCGKWLRPIGERNAVDVSSTSVQKSSDRFY